LRWRREEVEVLPQRAADARRDTDVVLQPGEAGRDGLLDEVRVDDGAALGPDAARLRLDADVRGAVADHEAAHAEVADEDVGAEAEHEVRELDLAGEEDGLGELVGRERLVEEVGRAADLEGRVGGEDLVGADAVGAEALAERAEEVGGGRGVGHGSAGGGGGRVVPAEETPVRRGMERGARLAPCAIGGKMWPGGASPLDSGAYPAHRSSTLLRILWRTRTPTSPAPPAASASSPAAS